MQPDIRACWAFDGDYFHIKGIKGNGHFGVAVHKEHTCYVEKIKIFVES